MTKHEALVGIALCMIRYWTSEEDKDIQLIVLINAVETVAPVLNAGKGEMHEAVCELKARLIKQAA
jgi:hypothetical protein